MIKEVSIQKDDDILLSMKLMGGKWSRGDALALVGVVAAVLAIPGMPG